jgi:hypothetical protein
MRRQEPASHHSHARDAEVADAVALALHLLRRLQREDETSHGKLAFDSVSRHARLGLCILAPDLFHLRGELHVHHSFEKEMSVMAI